MSDTASVDAEKKARSPVVDSQSLVNQAQLVSTAPPPTGWMYKSPKIGGLTLPYYASPRAQLLLVSFVCFLCPGMFNAINGLGGGGQVDPKPSTQSNTALYSTFAVVGFFAGTITNKLGVRWTLSLGGLGYSVYISAYLCYNHTQNSGYIIFAGALLGVCAGMLWSAQGVIILSYPTEQEKGRFISWFWMIFNLGGVIGSLVPLAQNIHVTNDAPVSDGTYIGFLVLTFTGGMLAWCLVDAKKVVRSDGSRVILMKNPTWKTELIGLWTTLQSDFYIVLLFPMFLASNWFYTYQFNHVNLAQFNTRTRSLNSVLYWTAQIIGAVVAGRLLDIKGVKRTNRAKCAWIGLLTLSMAVWGGGYAFQRQYTRADNADFDWTDSGYIGPMFLYIFYGFFDAVWQVTVYWFMGAITNSGRKLANFAGFYKGIQSAGGAITWGLDNRGIPYMSMFASCWALLIGSLIVALPVMIWKIKDTVSIEDDLKDSDETMADVIGDKPGEFQSKEFESKV